jgi:hypothetical protein
MKSIRLVSIDATLASALEEGRDRLQHDSDLRPGGAEAIVRDVVRQTMDLLARKPRHPPWDGYLTVDLTD